MCIRDRDRFFDIGDPNRQVQQVAINYDIPFNKIPTFNFLKTTYSYTGDYQWQKGSDLFGNLTLDGQTYDLGNSISNANTHNINSILDMQKFYRYVGLTKFTRGSDSKAVRGFSNANPKKTNPILKSFINLITTIKRIQINYSENNGSFLPGFLDTPGFIGSFTPSLLSLIHISEPTRPC